MFWKYNSPSSVQIDALLQKENLTLTELMEEEELLQECKVQNKKLIEFLTQPEVLEDLVCLVINDPPPDKELKARFKHANLAAELLTCDVPAIVDKVASSSNLLQRLYRFLEREKPLNPLLASFVSKVFGMLVQRRSEQNWYSYRFTCLQVLDFLKSRGDFVDVAVRHIGTSAVMDLLCKLICGVDDDDQEIKRDIHEWLNECHLVEQLLEKLSPECDSEEHSSVDQLIKEILSTVQETSVNSTDSQSNYGQSRLLATLGSKEVVNKLMDTLLHEDRNESSVSHVINILLTLLSCKDFHKKTHPHTYAVNADSSTSVDTRNTVFEAIVERLPELLKILSQPSKLGTLKTAYGMEVERLGSTRLQVINLITALIATNDIQVHSAMASLKAIQILLDLFFKFSLNNFLHTQVTVCVTSIIRNPVVPGETCSIVENTIWSQQKDECPSILNNNQHGMDNGLLKLDEDHLPEGKDVGSSHEQKYLDDDWSDPSEHPLLEQMFFECNIIQKILTCYSEANTSSAEKRAHNMVAYMGHIREIANVLVESTMDGPNSNKIKRLLELLPNDVKTDWEDFAHVTLPVENLKNKIIPLQMTGNSVHESDDDSDDDFTPIAGYFPAEKVESLVIMNQGFKEGDMEAMADLRFAADDFKDEEEHLSGALQRLSNKVNAGMIIQSNTGMDENGSNIRMDLFEKLCSDRTADVNEFFEDMWKDKEKNITFGNLDKAADDDGGSEHSSSEEEGDLEDEFESIRSTGNGEKMDVDFVPDDWSDVFDKRENTDNIDEAFLDSSCNPWQSAPAADTADNNSWADFGASPFENCNDPLAQSDSQDTCTSTFPSCSPSAKSSTTTTTTLRADFSNVLFTNAEQDSFCSGAAEVDRSSFQDHFDTTISSAECMDVKSVQQPCQSVTESVSFTVDSLQDICDVNHHPVENLQEK